MRSRKARDSSSERRDGRKNPYVDPSAIGECRRRESKDRRPGVTTIASRP
jgi:hypothetical protein